MPSSTVFDSERAKLAGIKSGESRRRQSVEAPALPVQPPLTVPPPVHDNSTDEYTSASLPRVRSHLERLNKLLETETDPAKLDRLAAAFGKLSEIERQLAGRPLPGSLRPGTEKRPGGLFTRPAPGSALPQTNATPSKFEQE